MKITLFKNKFETKPTSHDSSWNNLKQLFSVHINYSSKDNAPMFAPAIWGEGKIRRDPVDFVTLAVLDADKITKQQYSRLRQILEPYAYYCHTTWSHPNNDENYSLRFIIQLSNPVAGKSWPAFWGKLNRFCEHIIDQSCKNDNRIYWLPSSAQGESDQHFAFENKGEPLDTGRFLGAQKDPKTTSGFAPNTANKFNVVNLERVIKRFKASNSENKLLMAKWLELLLAGKPYAEVGDRDNVTYRISSFLGKYHPEEAPENLAEIFRKSLEAMAAISDDAPTMDDVIQKIARMQAEAQGDSQAEPVGPNNPARDDSEEEIDDATRVQISEAFKGKRDWPYTQDELQKITRDNKVSLEQLKHRWILQRGSYYYILKDGSYGSAIPQVELSVAARSDLAPAYSAGVRCWKKGRGDTRILKNEKELMAEYGMRVGKVVADLTATKTYYNSEKDTLVEAVCPLRKLKGEFSDSVDKFLQAFAQLEYEKLLDWMAVVINLDEPCAALFVHGAPGAGKGLLTNGLARLWRTEGPAHLKDAMSAFNDSIASCPLVVADEKLPNVFKREGSTADLRSFIQERTRPLRRKFRPPSDLVGATRLIITANNKDILVNNEEHTNDDIAAIKDRFLCIKVTRKATDYLNSLTYEQRRELVEGDAIAKHALWLSENRVVKRTGRFLVSGNESQLHDSLMTGTGLRSSVLGWLISFVLNPEKIEAESNLLIRIKDNKLYATARGIVENWEAYVTNTDKRHASERAIARVLKALSSTKKKQFPDGRGVQTNYRAICSEYLLAWNAEHGSAINDEISAALRKDTSIGVMA